MTAPRSTSNSLYESLTRRHGVKVECKASVEDCCLAVGHVVGHSNILSASRMSNAVVLFLSTVEKANNLIQTGLVLRDQFTPVHPLSTPAKKVILSNVPPFIRDELLSSELARFGKLVSPIKKLPLGCKSPLVRHLVSFRRLVYMVLKDGADELNLVLKVKVDEFGYTIFVSSDTDMKCFRCGQTGHLIRACPDRKNEADTDGGAGEPVPSAAEPAAAVPPAAVVGPVRAPVTGEPTQTETERMEDEPPEERTAVGEPAGAPEQTEPAAASRAPAEPVQAEEAHVAVERTDAVPERPDHGPVTEALCGNTGREEAVELEVEPVFKAPVKRKKAQKKGNKQVKKGVLEIRSVDVGVVAIRGLSSNYYLAISRRGELYGEREYSVNCRLKERIEENGYNTYSSARWRNRRRQMFVGLSANGRPLRAKKTRRKNTTTHFLPILV